MNYVLVIVNYVLVIVNYVLVIVNYDLSAPVKTVNIRSPLDTEQIECDNDGEGTHMYERLY